MKEKESKGLDILGIGEEEKKCTDEVLGETLRVGNTM